MLTQDTLLCGSAVIMPSSGTLLSLSVMAGRHVCLSLRWNLLIFPREVSLDRYMIYDQSLPLLAIASCQRPMKGSFPSLLSFLLSLCPQGRVHTQSPTTGYAMGFPRWAHRGSGQRECRDKPHPGNSFVIMVASLPGYYAFILVKASFSFFWLLGVLSKNSPTCPRVQRYFPV